MTIYNPFSVLRSTKLAAFFIVALVTLMCLFFIMSPARLRLHHRLRPLPQRLTSSTSRSG